ncbi:hypothetical protein [Nostoc sp. CCY0012]|uniref:hypothetical protein n=1 Tax=Nostoc sp. CCY0012 TaxID=1056123 RepID=UPI0039C63696
MLGIFERKIPHREEAGDTDFAAIGADVIVYGLGRYGGRRAIKGYYATARIFRCFERVVGVDIAIKIMYKLRD